MQSLSFTAMSAQKNEIVHDPIDNDDVEHICSDEKQENGFSTAVNTSKTDDEVYQDKSLMVDDIDITEKYLNCSGRSDTIEGNFEDYDDDFGTTPTGRKKRKRGKHKRKHMTPNPVDPQNVSFTNLRKMKKSLLTRFGDKSNSAETVSEIVEAFKNAKKAKDRVTESSHIVTLAEDDVAKLESKLQEAKDTLNKAKNVLQNDEDTVKIAFEKVAEAEMKIPCNWNNNFAKLKKYYDKHGNIGERYEKFRWCI